MADAWVVVMAASTALGAWWAAPVPWWIGAIGVVGGLWQRSPPALSLAALLLASGLGHAAWAGATPLAAGPVHATVTLLDDPATVNGAVRATARLGRAHVELWARGGAAGQLRMRLAGEQVGLLGREVSVSPSKAHQMAARHIRGQITVLTVTGWAAGDAMSRAANRVRRTLTDGAEVLPPTERSLFLGFVIGDDRDEPAALVDAFRDAGLAHLTAVSGGNVS